jgi:serine phosphatase RsbU (regulator of sigma subunit)/anti-sigma regulatory factor (Ser/Thr protein kinase)
MGSFLRSIRERLQRTERDQPPAPAQARQLELPPVEIAPDDPIVAHLLSTDGPVDIQGIEMDSPALRALKGLGVRLAVPLRSQGELIGLLNLGPRLSEQEYLPDDLKLLDNLAARVAPAVRVAQLVREQQAEAQERERIQQELRVASLIQQTLLPKKLPEPPGWEVGAYYQPARAVGGDFYDFIDFPDGYLGIIVGDVTDKGVPAALVMATTRSILRAAAQRLDSPGNVLQRVNDLLCPDIPQNMFVTCLYAVLDTTSGRLYFANAGHNLPYLRTTSGVMEVRATGMPLGLMPEMSYEEQQITLGLGDSVLFHSDGLVEAHNAQREMFGFPKLMTLVASHPGGAPLIDHLLAELSQFTGPAYEQEDDITLVTLQRTSAAGPQRAGGAPLFLSGHRENDGARVLAEFELASEPGNERNAMERVADAVQELQIEPLRLERLKTATAEATMNAIEHGNKNQADLPVTIQVLVSGQDLAVRVTDHGGGQPIAEPEAPDLESKLAGAQSPRGWGLYLIRNMVDDLRITSDETHHTLELVFRLGGGDESAG